MQMSAHLAVAPAETVARACADAGRAADADLGVDVAAFHGCQSVDTGRRR